MKNKLMIKYLEGKYKWKAIAIMGVWISVGIGIAFSKDTFFWGFFGVVATLIIGVFWSE